MDLPFRLSQEYRGELRKFFFLFFFLSLKSCLGHTLTSRPDILVISYIISAVELEDISNAERFKWIVKNECMYDIDKPIKEPLSFTYMFFQRIVKDLSDKNSIMYMHICWMTVRIRTKIYF